MFVSESVRVRARVHVFACVFAHILQVEDEAAMSAGLSEQLARITGTATSG
jgi:uncharacterized membrane protein